MYQKKNRCGSYEDFFTELSEGFFRFFLAIRQTIPHLENYPRILSENPPMLHLQISPRISSEMIMLLGIQQIIFTNLSEDFYGSSSQDIYWKFLQELLWEVSVIFYSDPLMRYHISIFIKTWMKVSKCIEVISALPEKSRQNQKKES